MFNKLFNFDRRATIAGNFVPEAVETKHFLLVGSTGSGKSVMVDELLDGVLSRGDRVIVCDPNGHAYSRFGGPYDRILNPFDARAMSWEIFNEIRSDYDFDAFARSIVPSAHGADAQWHHYAQVLLAETMRELMIKGEGSVSALVNWLTRKSTEDLAKLLSGSAAAGLFEPNAAKALGSTRFVITTFLTPYKFLHPGNFSIREWYQNDHSNLFITWREDMRSALNPLIGCWVDVLCHAILSAPPTNNSRVWLILDEIGALRKIDSLESALTRGRKHGLCVVAGLQSTSQLDRVYGRDEAIVMRSCFKNLVALSVAKSDPDTAEAMSRSLGEREVNRTQLSKTIGPDGISTGESLSVDTERLVLPGELTCLPDLSGYLAFSGESKITRFSTKFVDRKVKNVAIEER